MTDTEPTDPTTFPIDRRTDPSPTEATEPTTTSPGPCTRCGRAGHTTTLEGAIVCRACITHANAEDTTREIDQCGLEGFA